MRGRVWRAAILGIALLTWSGPALAVDYLDGESPAPASADEVASPLEAGFSPPSGLARSLEDFRAVVRDQPPFLRDGRLRLHLRTDWFRRDVVGGRNREAWALGGNLAYTSGWLAERVQLGAVLYTSQPLWAPDDSDGSLLLAPGQEAITVLGQAYLRLRLLEGTNLTIYRQDLDLPFINRRDNRMVPNTFEGVTLLSDTWRNVKVVAGHLTGMKPRDANSFVSMSEAGGISGSDEGLTMGGMLFSWGEHLNWGFIDEYAWDFMNTFYSGGNYSWKGPRGASWKLSAQYARQSSAGDELGGSFDTWFAGLRASAGWQGAVLTLAACHVDQGAAIINPWGGHPSYLSLMISSFNQPEEQSWLVGLSYDFARVGLSGLSGFANYASGHRPDGGNNAGPDEQELDLTLDWRPAVGQLKGAWLRLRAGYLSDEDDGATNEYQFIVNYDLDIL